jgi:hypothetical protein
VRVSAYDLGLDVRTECIREIVIRRVRLREELKPVKAYWHSGADQPNWVVITHVIGPRNHESFDLQLLKVWYPASETWRTGVGLTSYMLFETLHIAKAQAHADISVEYVEWEPCNVEITNEDGSVDWGQALR